MLKKIIIGTTLATSLLVGFGAQPLAETTSTNSAGTIHLVGDDTAPTPVDPNETITPEDGKETGSNGPLSIDYVPNFLFGDVTIGSTTVTAMDTNSNPFIQVSDKRGTGEGWTLKLAATPFKNEEKGTQLAGTTLTIGSINAQATDGNNPSAAPTVQSQAYGTIETDGKIIMKAAKDAGMGKWKGKFKTGNDNTVQLTVPSGNKAGDYTSVLTWTLSDAPE